MLSLDAFSINQSYLHRILLNSVAPRPIAFVSTIDDEGRPNLAPFSFFNAFGVNPGTLIFSPARRGRNNTTKHTYQNLRQVPEAVVNVVSYSMVQQVSLASTDFPKGVNEFEKAGFTPLESLKVRPFRVAESPVQYECRVRQIIPTGQGGGAANLVICSILKVHIDESVLDENNEIDPDKMDLVGRMGGNYYVRADQNARFIVPKPLHSIGIGIDALPPAIRFSKYLTGNDLGRLGNIAALPDQDLINRWKANSGLQEMISNNPTLFYDNIRALLDEGKTAEALSRLMAALL